jgi:hypothetical protein
MNIHQLIDLYFKDYLVTPKESVLIEMLNLDKYFYCYLKETSGSFFQPKYRERLKNRYKLYIKGGSVFIVRLGLLTEGAL